MALTMMAPVQQAPELQAISEPISTSLKPPPLDTVPEQPEKTPPPPPPPSLLMEPVRIDLSPATVTLDVTPAEVLNPADFRAADFVDAQAEAQAILDLSGTGARAMLVNEPHFQYPREMSRRGIDEGTVEVVIEIGYDDRADVVEVLQASHPALRGVAQEIVRRGLFRIDGEERRPVRVRWSLRLRAPG
ncbi:MAG: energy transducer TonB [Opitutales bacterium]